MLSMKGYEFILNHYIYIYLDKAGMFNLRLYLETEDILSIYMYINIMLYININKHNIVATMNPYLPGAWQACLGITADTGTLVVTPLTVSHSGTPSTVTWFQSNAGSNSQ